MCALRIQNTSESDPHGYEATKAVVKKAQKSEAPLNSEASRWSLQNVL